MTTDSPQLRKTPLHPVHREHGAAMAPFGGWEMPLWYKAGAIKEHLAVVGAAGLFDTSHMDVLFINGDAAETFLDYAFTRDVAGAPAGRCLYGAFLDENGHCLDDGIVYPLERGGYAVVINASQAEPIRRHLLSLPDSGAVDITAPEKRLGKIDLQGPAALRILRKVMDHEEELFAQFPYFTFKGDFDLDKTGHVKTDWALRAGIPVLLSRTGYTGEFGFEIFVPGEQAQTAWDIIMKAGEDEGILPCGLAARDSLRTGAVLPLSHQDIGPWPFVNHPWTFALPLDKDGAFTKKFHGSDALKPDDPAHTYAFVGRDPRRVDAHEAAVILDGNEIGVVTTIVSDMAIGLDNGKIKSISSPDKSEGWTARGLACGFVRVDRELPPGTKLVLKDKRREIPVETTQDIRPARTARKALSHFA